MTATLLGLITAIIAGLFCGATITEGVRWLRRLFGGPRLPPIELSARQILLRKGEPEPKLTIWQRMTPRRQVIAEPDWRTLEALILELRQDSKRTLEVLLLDMTPKQLEQLRARLRKVRPAPQQATE